MMRDSDNDKIYDILYKLYQLCLSSLGTESHPDLKSPKKANAHFVKDLNEYSQDGARAVIVDKHLRYTQELGMKSGSITVDGFRQNDERLSVKVVECFANSKTDKIKKPWVNGYLLEFDANGQKHCFFIRDGELAKKTDILIKELYRMAPVESIESKYGKYFRQTTKPYSKSYWSKRATNWDEQGYQELHYDMISDPMIMSAVQAHILDDYSDNQPLVVVDVGGGKGRLAGKLLKLIHEQYPDIKVNYILIEPDNFQAGEADKTLRKISKEFGKSDYTVEVFHGTLDTYHKSDLFRKIEQKANVVISSGGPLNLQVVGYHQALDNLDAINDFLTIGGKLIATGLSPLLLTKKDFQKKNLNVVSSVDRKTEGDYVKVNQLYICEKLRPQQQKHSLFSENHSGVHRLLHKPHHRHQHKQRK